MFCICFVLGFRGFVRILYWILKGFLGLNKGFRFLGLGSSGA